MIFLYAYLITIVTWAFYVAAINLIPRLPELHPIARVHATAVVLAAIVLDAVFHFVVGTALFLDRPRELLLTKRLKRYLTGAAGERRQKVAAWICEHLLDPFDPSGSHCR